MAAPLVTLYVQGMRGHVVALLERLRSEIGDATIWRDEDLNPAAYDDAEYAKYQGHVGVELHQQGIERRTDAIAKVAAAVMAVDPEHETVTGGDIFKKPLD